MIELILEDEPTIEEKRTGGINIPALIIFDTFKEKGSKYKNQSYDMMGNIYREDEYNTRYDHQRLNFDCGFHF